jgi:hypothetical protein
MLARLMARAHFLAPIAFLLAAAPPARAASDEVDAKAPIAVVDGRPIDGERFARFVLAERERDQGAAALDQIVQERLVERAARRRGIRVTAKEIDSRLAELEAGMREQSQGRAGIEDQLAALKMTREEFRALLAKSIACERMMALDFSLPQGSKIPPEKQSLWFQELKSRERVRTDPLPPGAAAVIGDDLPETIGRTELGLRLFKSLPPPERDQLFDEFVGVEVVTVAAAAQGLEVTRERIDQEVAERTLLLRARLAADKIPGADLDYLGWLKSRGEDPQAFVATERFRAEILLKEMTRARHGEDGFRHYYEARRALFDAQFGRRVRLSTIFLKGAAQKSAKVPRTWAEAQAELEQLKSRVATTIAPAAETFVGLAKLRSEDASASRGGDLGFLAQAELERRGLPKGLLDAKPGTIEGPLTVADGAHLLLVVEQKDSAPFEEIAAEVEKAARREVMKELREGKTVERRI